MGNVTINDFQKFDIRIGTIVKAEVPEWSHWVMKLTVDLGSEIGERVIFAGIMHFFKPKQLEGKQSLFIVNLEPKKIGPEGDSSQGMMLMGINNLKKSIVIGDNKIDEEPVLITPAKKVPNGTRIQ